MEDLNPEPPTPLMGGSGGRVLGLKTRQQGTFKSTQNLQFSVTSFGYEIEDLKR